MTGPIVRKLDWLVRLWSTWLFYVGLWHWLVWLMYVCYEKHRLFVSNLFILLWELFWNLKKLFSCLIISKWKQTAKKMAGLQSFKQEDLLWNRFYNHGPLTNWHWGVKPHQIRFWNSWLLAEYQILFNLQPYTLSQNKISPLGGSFDGVARFLARRFICWKCHFHLTLDLKFDG